MPVSEFKPFEEMTDKDYAEIGFKSGLEVHQQLLTDHKLFCRCPAGKYSDEYHAEILRHMRPTLSELGEYDGTALMEFKTKKEIIYRINRGTVCTYEMDDTPPFEINEQALDIAIEYGLLLNSTIVDELHIARKQYLDGSIPTGFQRTAIVSVGGRIPYKNREINIIQMSIEEDSCREVSDIGHRRVYKADRLGMPLIETVTAPEMVTPNEVAEVNELIRRLSRSTGHVRSGIGACREDVNVSVHGGTRIEIKGVSKIKTIPLLTYNEAMRQWSLLRLRDELNRRGITADTFQSKFDNVTKLFLKTRYKPIADAIGEGKLVYCVTLQGFKNLLSWQTQTDTFFSKEISDRVRVIACLTSLPNIIHSDYQGETISSAEGKAIRKFTGATTDDTLVLVWGDERDVTTASKEIEIRAKEATIGVPSETRQALYDGTNGFERILPGADRMYPDTDLPPKSISEERVQRIKATIPTQFWKLENWYNELGVPKDVIKPLAVSKYARLFEILVNEWKIDPVFASVALIQYPKKLKKKRFNIEKLTPEIMEKVFLAYRDKIIIRDAVILMMEQACPVGEFSDDMLIRHSTEIDIIENILKVHYQLDKIKLYNQNNRSKLLFGLSMKNLRGKAHHEDVRQYIDKIKNGVVK